MIRPFSLINDTCSVSSIGYLPQGNLHAFYDSVNKKLHHG
jgi:hypothetical protein